MSFKKSGIFFSLFLMIFFLGIVSAVDSITSTSSCNDSDGGKNSYLYGKTQGLNNGNAFDFCIKYADLGVLDYETLRLHGGNTGVIEHYCDDYGNVANEGIECSDGCSNGACKQLSDVERVTCEIDYGTKLSEDVKCKVKYQSQSAECVIKVDTDQYNLCYPEPAIYISKPVPDKGYMNVSDLSGQFDGIKCGETETSYNTNGFFVNCKQTATTPTPSSSCNDSDGGKNSYLYGKTQGLNNGNAFDFCIKYADLGVLDYGTLRLHGGNTGVIEHYCDDYGNVANEGIECSDGCSNGACIKNKCDISDSSLMLGEKSSYNINGANYQIAVGDIDGESFVFFKVNEKIAGGLFVGESYTFEDGSRITLTSVEKDRVGFCFNGEIQTRTEQVACLFNGTDSTQTCSSDRGFICTTNGQKTEEGYLYCVMNVSGAVGKLNWKSSCGGHQSSEIDGDDEVVLFDCVSGKVDPTLLAGEGFESAYWQCYNGEEQGVKGEVGDCKSSETWQKYAKEFCKDKCSKDGSKCGANSFSVGNPCYIKSDVSSTTSGGESVSLGEDVLVCKDSCPLEGKCYPFGYRKWDKYCSDKGSFDLQVQGSSACENNFECDSNLCVDGSCVSSGVWQKFLKWISSLFG